MLHGFCAKAFTITCHAKLLRPSNDVAECHGECACMSFKAPLLSCHQVACLRNSHGKLMCCLQGAKLLH